MNEVLRVTAPVFVGALALGASLWLASSVVTDVPLPKPVSTQVVLAACDLESVRLSPPCRVRIQYLNVHRKPILGVFAVAGINEATLSGVEIQAGPGASLLGALQDVQVPGVSSLADIHVEDLQARVLVGHVPFSLAAAQAGLTPSGLWFRSVRLVDLRYGRAANLPFLRWNEAARRFEG